MRQLRILFLKCQSGATAVEYGLIAALIGVVIISGATLVGQAVNNMFINVDARVITSGSPSGS
jgi:pilus assembly protein Flp/PilA